MLFTKIYMMCALAELFGWQVQLWLYRGKMEWWHTPQYYPIHSVYSTAQVRDDTRHI